MKLFVVIYIAGLIGGTVGPLPYGEGECKARVTKDWAALNNVTTPQGFTKADIVFACEWHDRRPTNDPKAGQP